MGKREKKSDAKPTDPGPDYDYPKTLAELLRHLGIKQRARTESPLKKLRDEQAEEAVAARVSSSG